jgi:microcystin-dependent protein
VSEFDPISPGVEWPAVSQSTTPTATATSGVPAGSILMYGSATAPTGWLLCDGSSVGRSEYASLFAAIGTTFGSVDGSHFTLPDLRGRFPIGKAAAGTGSTLGGTGGTIDHAHAVHSSVGDHTHDSHGSAVGDHNLATNTTITGGANRASTVGHTGTHSGSGDHSHNAHSAQNPPFQSVNFIVKT